MSSSLGKNDVHTIQYISNWNVKGLHKFYTSGGHTHTHTRTHTQ